MFSSMAVLAFKSAIAMGASCKTDGWIFMPSHVPLGRVGATPPSEKILLL